MWHQACREQDQRCNCAGDGNQRDKPCSPCWIAADNVNLYKRCHYERIWQQPAAPTCTLVIRPHYYDSYTKERADGRSKRGQVILVKESCYTEENSHCQQPGTP